MFTAGLASLMFWILLPWHWIGLPTTIEARQFDVNCTSNHAWMVNSKGQTPCLVAAYLNYPCTQGGQAVVVAMNESSEYYRANDEACQCNMVAYALFEACQACQFDNGTVVLKYSNYTRACTTHNLYPGAIPDATAVPAWAYQNVTSTGMFNMTAASIIAAQGKPDTTGTAQSGPSPTVTFIGTTVSAYYPPRTSQSTASQPDLVRPLVGGIVGGVIGLMLLTYLALLLHRRGTNGDKPMRSLHEQSSSFLSQPAMYPASPEWVYEPWSPASPTLTSLRSTVQGSYAYRQPYPFSGLGSSSSTGAGPMYHAVVSYTGAPEL